MKTLCFINSSKTIHRILNEPTHARQTSLNEGEDWELKFSTFKSDDYQFHDELPQFFDKGFVGQDSIDLLSYQLESEQESEEGYNQADEKEKPTGLCLRKLCFRNSRQKIMRILNPKNVKTKKLNFCNSRSVILNYFPNLIKFID